MTSLRDPAERAAAFERLFQAAEKQARGFVPFPQHLRSVEDRSLFAGKLAIVQSSSSLLNQHHNHQHQQQHHQSQDPVASTSSTAASSSPSNAAATAAAREAAREFCVSRVSNLAEQTSRARAALAASDAAKSQVDAMQQRVDKMIEVTKAVRDYSERMSVNASALIAKRARLEAVLGGLSDRLKRFQKVDALHDEALSPKLVATSTRFVHMLDEIEEAAAFLAETSQHSKASSHQVYSTRLSIAYQRGMACLRDHCCDAIKKAQTQVWQSTMLKSLLRDKKLVPDHSNAATAASVRRSNVKAQPVASEESKSDGDEQHNKEHAEAEQPSPSDEAATTTVELSGHTKLQQPVAHRPSTISEAMKLIDTEFFALLQPSETAFRLVEARIGAREAEAFVSDVFSAYSDARVSIEEVLLVDYSENSLRALQNSDSLSAAAAGAGAGTTTSAPSFNVNAFVHNIVEMCVVESSFFQQLWVSDLSASYVRGPLEALVTAGYSVFRAKLLHLDNVGQLASLSASLGDIQRRLQVALRSASSAAQAVAASAFSLVGPSSSVSASSSAASGAVGGSPASSAFSSTANLRNELVAHAVHRFVQDTDDRLTFRISIYLRNGLCAAAHHSEGNELISDFVLREAIAAIASKVLSSSSSAAPVATQAKTSEGEESSAQAAAAAPAATPGLPMSSALPLGFSAPFCLAPVIRLRWLCAQLKRCASGPAAFAGFIEEAASLVIQDIGVTVASWLSSGACATQAKKVMATHRGSSDNKENDELELKALIGAAEFAPFSLGLRQLLLTREALLSVGARLSTVETEFSLFSSMQILKVEKEVPRIVEAPFRELCDKSIAALSKGLTQTAVKPAPTAAAAPASFDSSLAEDDRVQAAAAQTKALFRFFVAALQVGLEQSVATQQMVWRGAVPLAAEAVMARKIKEDDPEDPVKKLADSWISI